MIETMKSDAKLDRDVQEAEKKLGRKIDLDDLGIKDYGLSEMYTHSTMRKLARRKQLKDLKNMFLPLIEAFRNPTKKR